MHMNRHGRFNLAEPVQKQQNLQGNALCTSCEKINSSGIGRFGRLLGCLEGTQKEWGATEVVGAYYALGTIYPNRTPKPGLHQTPALQNGVLWCLIFLKRDT